MRISEVSEKYDLTPDTLRYYERVGLILPSTTQTAASEITTILISGGLRF